MPTFEEFKELVRKMLSECLKNLSEKEIDEYINSEESMHVIQSEYNMSVKQYKNGEITETIFRNGSVGAVVSCLDMLY